MNKNINIKVIKENTRTVTIKMLSVNRIMPVPKSEFEKRVEQGLYNIVE